MIDVVGFGYTDLYICLSASPHYPKTKKLYHVDETTKGRINFYRAGLV